VQRKQDKYKILSDAAKQLNCSSERKVQSWDGVWTRAATVTTWVR